MPPLPSDAQLWQALTRGSEDFVVVVDRAGVYRYVNRTAPGIEEEALIGRATLYDYLPAEDAPRVRAMLEQAARTGAPARYEVRVPVLDAWLSTDVLPVPAAGGVEHLVLQTRDLSTLKRVEAELRGAMRELMLRQDGLDQLVAERTARLEEANARLERLARTDDLTGALNRRAVLARLAEEARRQDRYGGDLSILMLDLDHFKRINDTYGHLAGDEALTHVGATLAEALRATDALGRYGGEEFLVLMPGTDLAGARRLAERVRWSLSSAPLTLAGERVRLTCSVGVAAASGRCAPDALLAAADRALYQAKEAGRDRVMVAD